MVKHYQKRHMTSFKCINSESTSVNTKTINEWLSKLPSLIEHYAPEDILNSSETG